jgi:hypothetical protein
MPPLGTDRYPPFTLADVHDYPARLDIDYPERLSRALALVKWWLLALPHYLVLGLFLGGGVELWRGEHLVFRSGGGLLSVLVLIAAVALLFTGRYPVGLFELVLGLNRWVLRVTAYVLLLTDRYPRSSWIKAAVPTGPYHRVLHLTTWPQVANPPRCGDRVRGR